MIFLEADFLTIIKALSNETRLNILKWLKSPEENFPATCDEPDEKAVRNIGVCVSCIQEKSGVSQSTVSNYLDILQRAGLVTSERHGKWNYYRRCEDTLRKLSEYINNEL